MGNRILPALQDPAHILALAAVGTLALALNNSPLLFAVLVVAIFGEAVYLIFAPKSRWLKRRIRAQKEQHIRQQREILKAQIFPSLSPDSQARFEQMVARREAIARQREANVSEKWWEELVRQLDFLLEQWLQFAFKEAQIRGYSESMARKGAVCGDATAILQSELQELARNLESETDFAARVVLEKRAQILRRRAEFTQKMGKVAENLRQQLELMEATFALVQEEILARPAAQIVEETGDLVAQTNAMARVLEEISLPEGATAG